MKVWRREIDIVKEAGPWILLYGRRKTGKTFIVENFIGYDVKYFVRRDRTILLSGEKSGRIKNLEEFYDEIKEDLLKDKRVFVDEVQRLPESFFDEISTVYPNGKLIMAGSTIGIREKVFSKNSPILGMVSGIKVGLINPLDALRALANMKLEKAIEYATIIRDPWVIPFLSFKDILRDIYRILVLQRDTIPRLIGEIFTEEEKELTEIYSSIMMEVGRGNFDPRKMANNLYGKGLLTQPDPRLLQKHLNALVEMDVLRRVRVYKKKKYLYLFNSPIFWMYFYLSDKHNLEERMPNFNEVKENLRKALSFCIQFFFADLFSEIYGGEVQIFLDPEIDFIIVRGKKPLVVGEVKWKVAKDSELERFLNKVSRFSCEKLFISKNLGITPDVILKRYIL